MSTLYIGDIHEKIDRLEELIGLHAPKASRIVLVGDYLDSLDGFGENTKKTVEWLGNNINKPNYYFLWGNHDLQYGCQLDNSKFVCSGYSQQTRELCKGKLTWDGFWTKLRFRTLFDGFWCSHAGWNENRTPKSFITAKEAVQLGYFDPMFAVGRARGGNSANPGCLWMDWNDEFSPVSGMNQIVGHTQVKGVEVRLGDDSLNFNVDTGLEEVLLVHSTDEWEILE